MLERLKTKSKQVDLVNFSIGYSATGDWYLAEKLSYNSGNVTYYGTLEELLEAELPEMIVEEEDLL